MKQFWNKKVPFLPWVYLQMRPLLSDSNMQGRARRRTRRHLASHGHEPAEIKRKPFLMMLVYIGYLWLFYDISVSWQYRHLAENPSLTPNPSRPNKWTLTPGFRYQAPHLFRKDLRRKRTVATGLSNSSVVLILDWYILIYIYILIWVWRSKWGIPSLHNSEGSPVVTQPGSYDGTAWSSAVAVQDIVSPFLQPKKPRHVRPPAGSGTAALWNILQDVTMKWMWRKNNRERERERRSSKTIFLILTLQLETGRTLGCSLKGMGNQKHRCYFRPGSESVYHPYPILSLLWSGARVLNACLKSNRRCCSSGASTCTTHHWRHFVALCGTLFCLLKMLTRAIHETKQSHCSHQLDQAWWSCTSRRTGSWRQQSASKCCKDLRIAFVWAVVVVSCRTHMTLQLNCLFLADMTVVSNLDTFQASKGDTWHDVLRHIGIQRLKARLGRRLWKRSSTRLLLAQSYRLPLVTADVARIHWVWITEHGLWFRDFSLHKVLGNPRGNDYDG